MSTWAVVLIIALVLGVILSNIMLLKYTTHLKAPDTFKAEKYKSRSYSRTDTTHDAVSKKEAGTKPASDSENNE